MKTMKELQEHSLDYFRGYTDALADIANELLNQEIYDRKHTGVLLDHLNAYVDNLLKEGM